MITPLFRLCSLLMAFLFGLSTSFQFNDPDWYFWLPLYATACVVNLVNGAGAVFAHKTIMHQVAKFALWLGFFLFIKVVMEDGNAEFCSLDMKKRVVREKVGSGLVTSSMFLQLKAMNNHFPNAASKAKTTNYLQYGMAVLVAISYGNSLVFFLFQKQEMSF